MAALVFLSFYHDFFFHQALLTVHMCQYYSYSLLLLHMLRQQTAARNGAAARGVVRTMALLGPSLLFNFPKSMATTRREGGTRQRA